MWHRLYNPICLSENRHNDVWEKNKEKTSQSTYIYVAHQKVTFSYDFSKYVIIFDNKFGDPPGNIF